MARNSSAVAPLSSFAVLPKKLNPKTIGIIPG
jgi:hypothetical protein